MTTSKILFNAFDKDFQNDPYPTYERLRREDPIHRSIFNTWVITRYSDADAILKDRRFQVDNLPERLKQKNRYLKEGNLNTLSEVLDKWLFFLEPPDHNRLKDILTPTFTQSVVENMRPEIQAMVDALLDKVEQKGEMDIIADFAVLLPALVIAKILGLPTDDYERINKWSSESTLIFEHPMSLQRYQSQNQIMIESKEYFLQKIREFKKEPNDGLISYLVNQQDIQKLLSESEIVGICIMLNAAAQETTKGLIGNGMLALLKDPRSLDYLKHNPSDIKNGVEELLRYDAPIQVVSRWAAEDVEMSGKIIHSGDMLTIYIGSANRDPEQFTDPDQLDFSRRTRNLAFGSGIHYCLGLFLAKLEAQIAIKTLIQRLPDIHLSNDKLEWEKTASIRRLQNLNVLFSSV
jgi:pimeloyl-[acyl-carrier protein] synthase